MWHIIIALIMIVTIAYLVIYGIYNCYSLCQNKVSPTKRKKNRLRWLKDKKLSQGKFKAVPGVQTKNGKTVIFSKTNGETTHATWDTAHSDGKHVYQIDWPRGRRGSSAFVGLTRHNSTITRKASVTFGVDLSSKKLIKSGSAIGTITLLGTEEIPDRFSMLIDVDGGRLGFGSEEQVWGHITTDTTEELFPTVATNTEGDKVTMDYTGTLDPAVSPGQFDDDLEDPNSLSNWWYKKDMTFARNETKEPERPKEPEEPKDIPRDKEAVKKEIRMGKPSKKK